MDAVALRPLAFVMIAGPQIVTSVILAASDRRKATSAAYVAGATLAITVAYPIFYFIAHAAGSSSGSVYACEKALVRPGNQATDPWRFENWLPQQPDQPSPRPVITSRPVVAAELGLRRGVRGSPPG